MRGLIKAFVCAACVFGFLLLPINGAGDVYAVNFDILDYLNINKPRPPEPSAQAKAAIAAQGYVYVKGGQFYADFAGLPDFQHFAQTPPAFVVEYPTVDRNFYYLGYNTINYTYRSKIINYLIAGDDALKRYKDAVKSIGFQAVKSFDGMDENDFGFIEFYDEIRWELLYDPDFRLDAEGIFLIESADTFRLLLIGRSLAYNQVTWKLEECAELRFYSLSRNKHDELDLLTVSLSNEVFLGSPPVQYQTPGAVVDSRNLTPAGSPGFDTPAATVRDIMAASPVFFQTPNALGDVREIPAANVTGLFTPNVFNDIKP